MTYHIQNLIFPLLFVWIVAPPFFAVAASVITVAAYFIVVQVITRKK